MLESNSNDTNVMFANSKDKKPRALKSPPNTESNFLHDFIAELEDKPRPGQLLSPYVLRTTRAALQIQQAADQNKSFPFNIK